MVRAHAEGELRATGAGHPPGGARLLVPEAQWERHGDAAHGGVLDLQAPVYHTRMYIIHMYIDITHIYRYINESIMNRDI